MTTTPLTGYYSTGYYYDSISPRYITSSALSGIIIAKAQDNNKLYAYYKHDGLPVLSGTRLYIDVSLPLPGAAPLIGDGGVITGSLNSITTTNTASAGDPPVELSVTYDLASLAGSAFWLQGLFNSSGIWDDGNSVGVRRYVNGLLADGIYESQFYYVGKLGSTLRASDGKAYKDGNLFSGTVIGGADLDSLGWLNVDPSVPAPLITTLYTAGLSSLPPVPPPRRFEDGRLYLANKPFTGTARLNSAGLVLRYQNILASSRMPVTVPLTAINERFSSTLLNNIGVVAFNQGYPATGYVGGQYFYKGMSTTNIGLSSYPLYFKDGKLANGVIGNQLFSFGVIVSG